jgi:small GTP-binding protein
MHSEISQEVTKVLLIGHSNAGKTALMKRITSNKFSNEYTQTMGIDFGLKTVPNATIHLRLQIWDTAGGVQFRQIISSNYYENTKCLCFVIDANDDFDKQKKYLDTMLPPMANREVQNIIVLTKSDCVSMQKMAIVKEQAETYREELATQGFRFEIAITSAKYPNDSSIMRLVNSIANFRIHHLYNMGPDGRKILSAAERQEKHWEEIAEFNERFQHFSKDPAMHQRPQDRDEAVLVFKSMVEEFKQDPDRIANLIEVAKPFINRHRRPWDKYLGITNTKTWNNMLKFARAVTLTAITHHVAVHHASEAELTGWKKHSLFAERRDKFYWMGFLGGPTHSQTEIDKLIQRHKL